MCSCFPAAFRLPPFASWPSCSRRRYLLPSRSAYQWLRPPDCDGVSMFHTAEMRPVPGASYTPGPWCSHGRHRNFSHHCRLPAAGPFPRYCFHLPEFWVTKLTEVHSRSPFPVFPLPVTSGWNTGPWAFSRASHPAVSSSACQERERALSTRPELTADQSTLHSQLSHSRSATSCRTSISQWPRTQAARVAGSAARSLVMR